MHQPAFKKLDALCATHPPPHTGLNSYEHRCLEVEYAICIIRAKREAKARDQLSAQAARATAANEANSGGNADAGLCNTNTDADPTGPSTATQGGDWAGQMLPQAEVADYVLGFGSLINTASRIASDPNAMVAIPVRMSSKVGYARAWNFQHPIAQITALGLEKTGSGSTARAVNGVVTPVLTTYEQEHHNLPTPSLRVDAHCAHAYRPGPPSPFSCAW